MATLDEKKISRARAGGAASIALLAVAAIGVILFAVLYPLARAGDNKSLLLLSYILPPVLIATGAAGSAACSIKFGGAEDRLIRQYIIDTCLENAQAMHPERDSLTFYIALDGCAFNMHANGYKENIVFDFSVYKRLSAMRRAEIATEIGNRLIVSFCRMYERGAKYKSVSFVTEYGAKKSKSVPIITDGIPDKKSFKAYLKIKRYA